MRKINQQKLNLSVKILTVLLLCVSFVSYFSFNYYHLFGHIESFSDAAFVLLQWIKLAGLVVLPAAVFLKSERFRVPAKFFLIIAPLISLFWIGRYIGLVKAPVHFEQDYYAELVAFMPKALILALFIAEAVLMSAAALLILIGDGLGFELYKSKTAKYKLKNLLVFIPVLIAVFPLSLFDNLVRLIPIDSGFYGFLKFKNFTVWHLLAFASIFIGTFFAYRFLKKKDKLTRYKYLSALSIALLVQYMSKASRLVGDGYNVYYTVIAFIPLFICNIGVPIAAAAVLSKNRILNNMAFFVHAAGALTVFFYFGKDEMSNFGTVISYSFLYFAVTHAGLFAICVLPTLLGDHKFRLKNGIIPMAYYACVILTAAIASEAITAITADMYGIEFAIKPNYAFSQNAPLPIPYPHWNITVLGMVFDMFYLPVLFLVYVLIFLVFYAGYLLIIELPKKMKAKKRIAAGAADNGEGTAGDHGKQTVENE